MLVKGKSIFYDKNTVSEWLSGRSCVRVYGRLGHTKDHYKNGTNCLPAWHTGFRVGVWQCNLTV